MAQYLCLLIPTAPCLENIGRTRNIWKILGKTLQCGAGEPMCTTVDMDIFQMLSIVKCFKYCHQWHVGQLIDSIALTPDAILKASLLFIRNVGWYLCKSLKRDGTHLHFKPPPPLLSWPWTDSQDFSALNGRTDGEQEKFYWIFIYPSPIHWENCYFRKMSSPRKSRVYKSTRGMFRKSSRLASECW